MKLLNQGITVFFLLSHPILADDAIATIDTSSVNTWTTISRSDTMIGTVEIFHEALNKLEYTIGLIAEKTFQNIHLKLDPQTGWYNGKLGLSGDFYVIRHDSDAHSGEFVLYGTGKIKIFPANILIRFNYDQLTENSIHGTVTISVNKRFLFLDKLVDRDVKKTLQYMQITGRNLSEDRMLYRALCQYGESDKTKTSSPQNLVTPPTLSTTLPPPPPIKE